MSVVLDAVDHLTTTVRMQSTLIKELRAVAEAAKIVQDVCHSSHPMTSCPRCMRLHDLLVKLPEMRL